MTLSYDGTGYAGWQIQPHAPTIQELIQQALTKITHTHTVVVGSGRTDAGVHAFGQVAHFSLDSFYDPEDLLITLNANLTPTIRIRHIEKAPCSFHARYSASKKIYQYSIDLSPIQNPLNQRYHMHTHRPIDVSLLKKALSRFVGMKDFTSFANESHAGSAARNPVKELHAIDCIQVKTRLTITFEGSGFLYKMVRNLMSTALQVAWRKLSLNTIDSLFAAKNRRLAPPPAPAKGLCLISVTY